MKLFFRKYGEGPPLIILHGLFGTADNWNTLGKMFGERFTTYLVDQRNHGQSPHAPEWNYALMVEDLLELMDDEQLQGAHIMGHSMGGKTAMFFALAHPQRTDKLVVSDIAPRYYPIHHRELIDTLLSIDLGSLATRKEAETLMQERIPDEATRQFLLKNLYWKEDRLHWRFNLEVINRNIEEVGTALPENGIFEGPTLFVRGERSNYITDADMDSIHHHFPQARLETIAGAGHWIHAEKPVAFLEAVMAFL